MTTKRRLLLSRRTAPPLIINDPVRTLRILIVRPPSLPTSMDSDILRTR
jgi:hypothetical protein